MNYEKDFADESIIDLDVKGYKKGDFKYQPTTAGKENEWLDEYMEMDKDGKAKQNFSKLNKLKLGNITAVPYSKELIKKLTNIDLPWADMDIEQKYSVFSRLKPGVFDNVFTAINKYDKGNVSAKKV